MENVLFDIVHFPVITIPQHLLYIYLGLNSVRGIAGPPSAASIYSVSNRGEVFVFDPLAAINSGEEASCAEGSMHGEVQSINIQSCQHGIMIDMVYMSK